MKPIRLFAFLPMFVTGFSALIAMLATPGFARAQQPPGAPALPGCSSTSDGAAGLPVNPPDQDDGWTGAQRPVLYGTNRPAGSKETDEPAFVIVHRSKPLVFFGLYRASQMTGAGWDIFDNSVNWLMNGKDHASSRVILFTYDGTICGYQNADGAAFYNRLITNLGFTATNVVLRSGLVVDAVDYAGYNLALYANGYGYPLNRVIQSGIPFLTVAVSHTKQLGIGTGDPLLHQFRSEFYVRDVDHPILGGVPPGHIFLPHGMWMDATEPGGDGVVLISSVPAGESIAPQQAAGSQSSCMPAFNSCCAEFADGSSAEFADDGVSADESTAAFSDAVPAPGGAGGTPAVLIVDRELPRAYFGFYRFSQMSDTIWPVFHDTIRWLTAGKNPAGLRILMFSYNGTLCYPDIDAAVAYNELITGYRALASNITVMPQYYAPVTYPVGYDLVLYLNGYGWDLTKVLSSGVPVLSTAGYHAIQMGIGSSGGAGFHKYVSTIYVQDVDHPASASLDLGKTVMLGPMWLDGVPATPAGRALVTATP